MKTVSASLNEYRQSPRKVRLVADLLRGKKVDDAKVALQFAVKKASHPLTKLLDSAIANAKNRDIDPKTLFVKTIMVDGGAILYRRMPRARGRAVLIRKRSSHVKLVLAEKEEAPKAKKAKATKVNK